MCFAHSVLMACFVDRRCWLHSVSIRANSCKKRSGGFIGALALADCFLLMLGKGEPCQQKVAALRSFVIASNLQYISFESRDPVS